MLMHDIILHPFRQA